MSTVLMIFVIITALLGMTVFNGNILFCLISIILGAGYFVLSMFAKGKLNDKLLGAIRYGLVILGIVLVSMCGIKHTKGGLYEYMDKMAKAEKLLGDEKYSAARNAYEDIADMHGQTDEITLAYATIDLYEEDYDAVIEDVAMFADPGSRIAYDLKLTAMQLKENEDKEKTYKGVGTELGDMYIEAAAAYPDWTYANLMAGCVQLDRDNISSADYFLGLAYKQDPDSWMNSFQYGVAKYRMGDDLSALKLYKQATEDGASDEAEQVIAQCLKDIIDRYDVEVE